MPAGSCQPAYGKPERSKLVKVAKFLKGIQFVLKILSAITICSLTVILAIQIVKRNIFLSSFPWAEELSVICMVWITFLGAAMATCSDTHTRIDFFIRKLPDKIYHGIVLLGNVICIGFLGVLIKYSGKAIGNNLNNLTPVLKLPVSVNYLGRWLGCVLMVVYFIFLSYLEVQHLRGIDVSEIEKEMKK